MPDQFIKFPRRESIQYFERAMRGHSKVINCTKISDSYYKLQREDMSPLLVFVSNYYALSAADYFEITEEYRVDCLITISNWNSVTQDAYEIGKANGIGVFTMNEFMGALNCAKPSTYIRPIDREDNDRSSFGSGRSY